MKKAGFSISVILCLVLLSTTAFAGGEYKISTGQTIYSSATYNVLYASYATVVTASRIFIRNVEPNESITVNSVDFYKPDGTLQHSFLTAPIVLGPHTSTSFLAFPSGAGPARYLGDSRPFFLVEWEASRAVNAPLVGAMAIIVNFPTSGGFPPDYDNLLMNSRVIRERGNQ